MLMTSLKLNNNEKLILSLLRRRGPIPRAVLAQAAGISAQAVTSLSKRLIAKELIQEGDAVRGKVGQPSTPLRLVPDGGYFLGLKIGRTLIELALVDFEGNIKIHRQELLSFLEPNRVLSFALNGISSLRGSLPASGQGRICGLGIAAPFRLWDWGKELEVWRGFDLQAELSQQLDLPTFYENDASTACGAELMFGRPDLPSDYLYIYIAHYPGGGIVLDGKLRLGPKRNAAALASVQVPGGEQLLNYAGVAQLERKLGFRLPADDSGWANVPEAALEEWAAQAGQALAFVSMAAASIADLSTIVIDGAVPELARQQLIESTQKSLTTLPGEGVDRPEILSGSLGRNARILGAAALPLTHFFQPV